MFFSDTLFGNKIFIHRDLIRFFYPLREFSVNEIMAGRIPLWNPYIHCGSPHLAELQTCVFYPLSVIYLLFSYSQGFNYFIIAHVFLAGFFTYLLMREWRYSRYAAFFSAIVFMFSGYIISVINLPASLASVIWLPLVILFYERALKKEWVKNSIITGIFMALMLLGGDPIILYATVFILILFGILSPFPCGGQGTLFVGPSARCGSSHSQSTTLTSAGKRAKLIGKCLLLALLISVGLSCFQILPFLEFVKYSSRGAMDFSEASMWSLPLYALLDLFIPYLSESDYLYKSYWTRQSWLLVYYMGVFTMICAFISLKFDTTKRRRVFFYILMLGLVLSFGRYTPIYYFLYRIMPGFSLQRYPIKFFFMVAFALAVLAGMGLDYYRKNISELKEFLKAILTAGFIVSFFYLIINLNFAEICSFLYRKILDIAPGFMDKRDTLWQLVFVGVYNLRRAIGIFMLLSLFMFLGSSKKIRSNLLIPVLLLVAFSDIFTANKNVYLNMDIDEYLEPGESIEFLKKDEGLFRIFDSPATLRQNTFVPEKDYFDGVRALKERMISNRGVNFGIYDAYGYGSLYNKKHEELIIAITELDLPDETNLLNLLNVKYLISPKEFDAKGYRVVMKTSKVNIYENENVLPRAFLVDKAIVIKNKKEILRKLKTKDFDPAKEIILEEDFSFTSPRTTRVQGSHESPPQGYRAVTSPETVDILKYSPNEIILEARVNESKFLIISDSYYPGWKVFVDGKRDKIYRADYILRAVHLGPGKHIIKFTYDPLSFKIGAIVTLVTVLMITILWIRKKL